MATVVDAASRRSTSDWLFAVRWALALPATPSLGATLPRARPRGRRHSVERDRIAVQHHYDAGNEFYALWLDRWMVYSCAYFPTGMEDLDAAQEAKLEHICRKLRLWLRNLDAHRDEAVARVGLPRFRTWRIFLAASAQGFAARRTSIHQALLARPDASGKVTLPWSRGDLYPR